ncbi:TPA: glycerate kinase [Bacillus thuringiensis]|uniref:Glycerate kinase n=6 Tax=Bacillus cereus group TaxID=86661 RepID=A0A9X6XXH2_BACCE|nr:MULTISPECIES: glycerate kinase [Bacillus]ANN30364.1 glycerate 2-kinase [Bacillus thuringiensis serovar coreanensis]AGE75739.1 Glycerate kinase [Bacillus thuringiensis serovar kurstaki str. HD73]AHZ48924.1 glycerate kinase [Bacillus thuringiensis serovar kurstaki str. YBT-1520]AIE31288.1 glycerate kinase [Bacillus thuringiensis serovar kurstaki str. HD-1]AIM28595.1 glycerate kinase [Bacillus thuringiensis serovar kurstaki str. YBT-1520]
MKVVIASDSYKESLKAIEVCGAIERGFRAIFPNAEYVKIPIGDGGEGTVESLVDATGGRIISISVTGPLREGIQAFYGISKDKKTAFIEMAAASGLQHVPVEKRNPLITTTKGTGELILHALDQGVEYIILGLGGSATNDGGAGMLAALGVRFINDKGEVIDPSGGTLHSIVAIDFSQMDPRLKGVKIEAACDVDNPLVGMQGASFIFGRQKGANVEMMKELDENLQHYANMLKRYVSFDVSEIPGAGAAGGMGAAVISVLKGDLRRGIEIVLDYTNFDKHIEDANLIITGEGRIDKQTAYGKAPVGVAGRAKRFSVPVIAIGGSVSSDYSAVYEKGIDAVFSITTRPMTLEEAYKVAEENIEMTTKNIAIVWKIASEKHF